MNISPERSAAAASDAYLDRSQDDVDKQKQMLLNGQKYSVFGYRNDVGTGFHGTAYQNAATGEVIIAYRGTDPDIRHHTRTTFQDAASDFTMVKAQINPQEAAARVFTQEMLDKAQAYGISRSHFTLAGHSSGGTLAQIEASRFGLRGVTFNAYGAVDLGYHVPEGGHQVNNFVMAGDVVSAASRHFGQVEILVGPDDLSSLRVARYLNAPSGAGSANPLLAMRVDDHRIAHFTGEGGTVNVLAHANLAEYQERYRSNKAVVDHFRQDVLTDRAEVAVALGHPGSRNIETTLANLPPHIRQQLAEYHAALVDVPVHQAVAHNRLVQGVEQRLNDTADMMRQGGQSVQHQAEHLSQGIHAAGLTAQQRADAVSRGVLGFAPIDPLVAAGLSLGAKAAGYVVRAETERVGAVTHLAGQTAHVGSRWLAGQIDATRNIVGQGAHVAAQLATVSVHAHEATLVIAVDRVTDTYQALKITGQTISHGAARVYDTTRQGVSRGIEAAERAACQTRDGLTDQAQRLFGHSPLPPQAAPTQAHARKSMPIGPTHAITDPRHPQNPDHALYNELHRRIPVASESRLMQFTAACHTNKITADNLSTIRLDETTTRMGFRGSSFLATPAIIDLNTPPPTSDQSIQHMTQYDQQQTQLMGQMQAQNAQINQCGQHGPMPGGH